ncbi:MAG: tetraacyldisaccharide 4'-kinase [Candidatus Omnitrophota bacterium]
MRDYLYKVITERKGGFLAGILKVILFLLSVIYSFLVGMQASAYKHKLIRAKDVDTCVISIGNITWGGTGKTPLTSLLAQFLTQQGMKLAILSRGYKKYRSQAEGQDHRLMGDEAYLLKEKNPDIAVLVGRDRVKNARFAKEKLGAKVILLDDGFQHRRIKRNLDIVLVDVLNPFGNGHCIPRGILREPKASLKRADVIVLTNCTSEKQDQETLLSEIRKINSSAQIVYASYQFIKLFDILNKEEVDHQLFIGKPVGILASIGNFASFKRSVNTFMGAKVRGEFEFPDHYEYRKGDIIKILDSCRDKKLDTIITTEKDAVRLKDKLSGLQDLRIFVLEVKMQIIKNSDKFYKAIRDVCIS